MHITAGCHTALQRISQHRAHISTFGKMKSMAVHMRFDQTRQQGMIPTIDDRRSSRIVRGIKSRLDDRGYQATLAVKYHCGIFVGILAVEEENISDDCLSHSLCFRSGTVMRVLSSRIDRKSAQEERSMQRRVTSQDCKLGLDKM